jgi:hypothetical protein
MKLNPDDLDVTSFDPGMESDEILDSIDTHPNDPTPATHCRICPTY